MAAAHANDELPGMRHVRKVHGRRRGEALQLLDDGQLHLRLDLGGSRGRRLGDAGGGLQVHGRASAVGARDHHRDVLVGPAEAQSLKNGRE